MTPIAFTCCIFYVITLNCLVVEMYDTNKLVSPRELHHHLFRQIFYLKMDDIEVNTIGFRLVMPRSA